MHNSCLRIKISGCKAGKIFRRLNTIQYKILTCALGPCGVHTLQSLNIDSISPKNHMVVDVTKGNEDVVQLKERQRHLLKAECITISG